MRGSAAWDTFQTLAATAQKLGIHLYKYVRDRIRQGNQFPSLGELIRERAQELQLDASWQDTTPRPTWKPIPLHAWHS